MLEGGIYNPPTFSLSPFPSIFARPIRGEKCIEYVGKERKMVWMAKEIKGEKNWAESVEAKTALAGCNMYKRVLLLHQPNRVASSSVSSKCLRWGDEILSRTCGYQRSTAEATNVVMFFFMNDRISNGKKVATRAYSRTEIRGILQLCIARQRNKVAARKRFNLVCFPVN